MKSLNFLTVMCLFFIHMTSLSQVLDLHHADGTTTSVDLKTMPEVTFSDQYVFVTSPTLNMQFHKDNVLSFTYSNVASGINEAKETSFTRQGDNLIFHGSRIVPEVAIYSLNGIRIPLKAIKAGSDISISISSLPTGIYILSINGKTSKFIKK